MKLLKRLLVLSALVLAAAIAVSTFALPSNEFHLFFKQSETETIVPGAAAVPGAPAPPLLAATPSSSSITISWQAVQGAATYEVWYREGTDPWKQLDDGSLTATTTSLTHLGLVSGQLIHYTARTVSSSGQKSPWAVQVSATVSDSSAVPTLTATPAVGEIELTWSSATGADGYHLITWTDGQSEWTRIGDPITHTLTSYTHTGLTAGVTYYYRVRSVTQGTEGDWSDTITQTPLSQVSPTLSATGAPGRVQLSWTAVTDADSYHLISWTTDKDNWDRIGDPITHTLTSYTHAELTVGTTYYYRVRAVIDGTEGAWSNPISAVPTEVSAPTLTATPAIGQIQLDWSALTGADSYQLIMFTDGLEDWERIGDPITHTATSYTHIGLTGGQSYYYSVRAIIDGVEADWSSSIVAIPLLAAAPVMTATAAIGQVELSWNAVTSADSYRLIVWTEGQDDWLPIGDPLTSTITSYTHSSLSTGATYYYRLRAVSNGAESQWSHTISAVPGSAAIPGLIATAANGQVELSWSAVTDAESYHLITWTDGQSEWTRIGDPLSSDTTSYTHIDAAAGVTYNYRVRAVVNGTNGEWSQQVDATP